MNLSVSNIAWNNEENTDALRILEKNEIHAIDIAPTLIFDSIDNLTKGIIREEYKKHKNSGLEIIAMQSLLYGIPSYSLFDGDYERKQIFQHMERNFVIAKELHTKNLVFGSPKNRYIKNENKGNLKTAINFFQKLCDTAKNFEVDICLEANPKEYGCNFITNTFEAVDFIKKTGKENFLLNLDTSTVILNKNDFEKVLRYSNKYIKHVHISSPYLEGISELEHEKISNLLRLYDYQGHISLEMKSNVTKDNLNALEKNVEILRQYYLG